MSITTTYVYCLCLPVCAYLSIPTCLYLPICTYLSIPTCLCLPVYTYLSIPTCLYLPNCAYLSMPACLYLPSVPPVCATVYTYLSVIWGKGRPDQRLCLIQLIVLIRIVLYGRSLAVYLNGGRLGCFPRGLDLIWRRADIKALVQFDRSIDRLIESFVVFAAWLFKRSSSGSGNGCRLVLARVVWF